MLHKERALCFCLIIVNFNSDQLINPLEQNIILENARDEQHRRQDDAARKFLKLKDTMKSEMVGIKETSRFNHSYMNSHLDNPDILPSPGQFMKDSRSDHLNVIHHLIILISVHALITLTYAHPLITLIAVFTLIALTSVNPLITLTCVHPLITLTCVHHLITMRPPFDHPNMHPPFDHPNIRATIDHPNMRALFC